MFSHRVCRAIRSNLAHLAGWAVTIIALAAALEDLIRWLGSPP
jgi:hypothetical protein